MNEASFTQFYIREQMKRAYTDAYNEACERFALLSMFEQVEAHNRAGRFDMIRLTRPQNWEWVDG